MTQYNLFFKQVAKRDLKHLSKITFWKAFNRPRSSANTVSWIDRMNMRSKIVCPWSSEADLDYIISIICIHSNLLVLKFEKMVHLVQLLKFEKSDFQDAWKCTSDYKINVKIALLFPKNYGVMTQVNAGDFMKLRKEANFHLEKLYFRIKHHIYKNAKQCLN